MSWKKYNENKALMDWHPRFWIKVEKTNGCWIWKSSLSSYGSGIFLLNGKIRGASRLAYLLVKGDVPKEMKVWNICKNKKCVNPDHMSLRGPQETDQSRNKRMMEKFWSNVRKTDTCWIWEAYKSMGYGKFIFNNQRWEAHRFCYTLFKGEIPFDKELDHLCRNPACVNPDHLEAVSHRENILRGNTLPSKNILKTDCPFGHEYSINNTRIGTNGARYCKLCDKKKNHEQYLKIKARGGRKIKKYVN